MLAPGELSHKPQLVCHVLVHGRQNVDVHVETAGNPFAGSQELFQGRLTALAVGANQIPVMSASWLLRAGKTSILKFAAKEVGGFEEGEPQRRQMLLMNSARGEELNSIVIGVHRQSLDGVPILHLLVRDIFIAAGGRHLLFIVIFHQPEGAIIKVLVVPVVKSHYRSKSANRTKRDNTRSMGEGGYSPGQKVAPMGEPIHSMHYLFDTAIRKATTPTSTR